MVDLIRRYAEKPAQEQRRQPTGTNGTNRLARTTSLRKTLQCILKVPGCPLSAPDLAVDDDACDEPEDDRECEQMPGDVQTVPCLALEPDKTASARS